jgi:hypothetical protein
VSQIWSAGRRDEIAPRNYGNKTLVGTRLLKKQVGRDGNTGHETGIPGDERNGLIQGCEGGRDKILSANAEDYTFSLDIL